MAVASEEAGSGTFLQTHQLRRTPPAVHSAEGELQGASLNELKIPTGSPLGNLKGCGIPGHSAPQAGGLTGRILGTRGRGYSMSGQQLPTAACDSS